MHQNDCNRHIMLANDGVRALSALLFVNSDFLEYVYDILAVYTEFKSLNNRYSSHKFLVSILSFISIKKVSWITQVQG